MIWRITGRTVAVGGEMQAGKGVPSMDAVFPGWLRASRPDTARLLMAHATIRDPLREMWHLRPVVTKDDSACLDGGD